MAATIKDARGLETKLIEGSNGIFDVIADGTTIFSKHAEERFPEPHEVIDALRGMTAA